MACIARITGLPIIHHAHTDKTGTEADKIHAPNSCFLTIIIALITIGIKGIKQVLIPLMPPIRRGGVR